MWRQAWAKAPRPVEDSPPLWLPLYAHLTDSGAVMERLWDTWAGPGPQQVLEVDAGSDTRGIAVLAAALHDIGKFSRAFAGQVPAMRTHMETHGFRWDLSAVEADARRLPHSVVGHIVVRDLLVEHGASEAAADAFAVVVGGHHGVPPELRQLHDVRGSAHLVGDEVWDEARRGLIEYVLTELDLHEALVAAARVTLSDASQMLLTGLVITADWIASNDEFFQLTTAFEPVVETARVRADRAWLRLRLPQPWQPTSASLEGSATSLLRDRFAVDYEANEVQQLALRAAREMPEPGLLIIEALMGVGKTEASLLAAEVLASRFGRSGVFYGLPTRATADAMFSRVLPWWQAVPDALGASSRSVQLRHSGAALNPEFLALPRVGRRDDTGPVPGLPAEVGIDEPKARQWEGRWRADAQAVAHYWTGGRKKAALADTVIATIDHELLSALASRHVVLRHLGLSRQVVVLDEVHAADVWMRIYLVRALEWLGRYGVPVIVLSATLPPDQRSELLQAYERGRRAALPARERTLHPVLGVPLRPPQSALPAFPELPATDDYPLLSYVSAGEITQLSGTPPAERVVEIAWLEDDIDLADLLATELDDGGCAVVVCNTVRRALERYRRLRDRFGERVHLAHSRFIGHDRVRNDDWLRSTFGPPGNESVADRDGRIVVATQVVEQSLDIDFDLLITDLAPIDLVLQRIGRLHRHPRSRPAKLASPRCLVTAFDPAEPTPESGAAKVYGSHLLLRSAALIDDAVSGSGHVALPRDIPALVRRCYGEESLGRPEWSAAMSSAAADHAQKVGTTKRNAKSYRLRGPGESASLIGMLMLHAGESDTDVLGGQQVRQGDGGFEVILLEDAEDGLRLLSHLKDNRVIPTDRRPDPRTSRRISRCTVRVPGWVTDNPRDMNAVLDDLASVYFPRWQQDPLLGGQLILLLDDDGTGQMGPFLVSYDPETGLEVSYDRRR